MTVSGIIGGTQWFDFATNKGMGDFSRWADRLDESTYPAIVHLADWGWVNTLDDLINEINDAVLQYPPTVSVQDIIDSLLEALESRDENAETIMLSNGMTETLDDDTEWWIDGKPI
jgi:hypothetical protein